MLGIMAGMEQKGFKFVDIPFVLQTLILRVQTIQQTIEFLQLLYVSGGRCTCCVGRAYHAALVSTTTFCAQGWLCWFRCASAVFLLIFGILAGMDQKDSCRGMYKAGIAGYNTPRAVLSFLVRRPMKLGIMAVKDSCSGSSMYKASFAGDCAHRAVFSSRSSSTRSLSSPFVRRDRSHGLIVQQTTEILLLQYIDKVFDVLVVHSSRFLGCSRREDGLVPTVAPRSRVQTWRKRSRSHSCNVDAGHCCSHACRFATTGSLVGRDSAVNCGGSAVGAHRLAFFGRVHRYTARVDPHH